MNLCSRIYLQRLEPWKARYFAGMRTVVDMQMNRLNGIATKVVMRSVNEAIVAV